MHKHTKHHNTLDYRKSNAPLATGVELKKAATGVVEAADVAGSGI